MSHQCIVNISNENNPYPITLAGISNLEGKQESVAPSSFEFELGQQIAAGGTLSFTLKRDLPLTAGAKLTWSTGASKNSTLASIVMTFRNDSMGNKAELDVESQLDNLNGKLAYGVSYFYASEEDNIEMSRDYLNSTDLKSSPVYVNYTIVCNSFLTDQAPAPVLSGITNVVMLMLENRGFDHLMGMLYTEDPKVVFPEGSVPPSRNSTVSNPINFDGLANNPEFGNPSGPGENANLVKPVQPGSLSIPEADPGEQWADTNQQVYDITGVPGPHDQPTMQGFLDSYKAQPDVEGSVDPLEILQYYTSDDLPVMSSLAKNYAVSDAWHCSVPSQTSPNRGFSLSGTSNGYVDNYDIPGIPATKLSWAEHSVKFKSNTIFNVMANSGNMDWKIYYEQKYLLGFSLTEELFEQLHPYKGTEHVTSIDQFYADIENDSLPAFSYLEPTWSTDEKKKLWANDYHPPFNVCPGEQNLAKIYKALTKYKHWDSTLFIVTFDEHGGTFDHAAPPSTIAPDAQTDWSHFAFDRLGIRVPTLLISPKIQEGTVFRSPESTPFDHTSFLKTILAWQNIDISGGALGKRAAQAPDFSGVVSSDVVNSEVVPVKPPLCVNEFHNTRINDLQRFALPFIAKNLSGAKPGSKAYNKVLEELLALKTVGELADYAKSFEG